MEFPFQTIQLIGVGVLWLPLKWAQLSMSLYYIILYIHICLRISQTSETLFELGPWFWLPLKWYQMISNMYVILCIYIYMYTYIYNYIIYIYSIYVCPTYLAHIRNTDQPTQSSLRSEHRALRDIPSSLVFREGWMGNTSIHSGN